jgi:hypothetical protein
MFEPTVNSNATASSPSHSSPAQSSPAANTPAVEGQVTRSPVPTRRADSEEVGEASMELDDETSDRSMEAGDSFGTEEPFDAGEGAGEDSMELTDTYQLGTPSRRRSSAPMAPLPPLDRSIERQRDNLRGSVNHQSGDSARNKDGGEFMVKVGKSIAPRRKSEAWAELQSLTHAGEETDEDSTGSTTNSDPRGGFIPASQESQGAVFSSQGTYTSYGTASSQESRTGVDGDLGLEDALSRLRAVRQSMGGGAADMSIDEDEDGSSSSEDFEGRYDDEDRTMDVTAVTGGLRFDVDDEEDEDVEAEAEADDAPSLAPPASTIQQTSSLTPAFTFTPRSDPENPVMRTSASAASKLPTFAIDPPSPAAPQVHVPTTSFQFAAPSSPKPVSKPASAAPAPTPAFSFNPVPTPAPAPPKLTPPSNVQPASSPKPRSAITFEVSQSPVRAPPVTWSPHNAPGPFEFALPGGGTPRRSSTSTGGLNITSTPARAITPVPIGTPKAVETSARALSAPPTPKRPREEAGAEESARKRVALEVSEPKPQQPIPMQSTIEKEKERDKGTEGALAKPPRRRSFAPRMSMSILGRAGRGGTQDSALPTISAARSGSPAHAPSPVRPTSPTRAQPPSPVSTQPPPPPRALSPPSTRVASPRPTTPPNESHEPQRQAPASPSLTRRSPRPAAAALEQIRFSSPLRSRMSIAGANMGAKSPAQWRTGVQSDAELDDVSLTSNCV